MNSKLVPVLIVIFVIIISVSGCIGKTSKGAEGAAVSAGGIAVEFQPGAPPQQISEDDEYFDISVKLENTGEYDVPVGEDIAIFLLGVNPETIGLCDEDGDGEINCNTKLVYSDGLRGAHYLNNELIPGEITYLNWLAPSESSPVYKLSITSDQTLNFVAQACYPYKTIATAEACFSANAYAQTTGAETCTVSGEKQVTNSIAPVQITKIVENPAGVDRTTKAGRYAFTFTIENVGGGTVFPYTRSVHDCTKLSVADLNANQVAITSVKVGGVEKPECLKKDGSPATITLVDGKGTYTCTISQPSIAGDYSDVLEITLTYNYYVQTKKQVVVKNTLDFGSEDNGGDGQGEESESSP